MGDLLTTSRQLKEKRGTLLAQMKDAWNQRSTAADETRKKELETTFDRIELEERALSADIARLERMEEIERGAAGTHIETVEQRDGKPATGGGNQDAEYRDAFKTWFTKGKEGLSPEQRATLEKRGTSNQLVGTTTLGGYTVPQGFLAEMVRAMKDFSGIAQAARILPTASGQNLLIPTEDDTTTSAVLIGEAAAITMQDLTFGQASLDAYKYASRMKASFELMQDSAFNIEDEIRRAMGPRFGRAMNSSCTTGTGSSQPNGVVTASALGKTAASATTVTFPEILDLKHSVDPAYRPNGAYMLNDAILLALKKLSIGAGDARPLWAPSYREGVPDTIDGTRYFINQGMASAMTTGQKILLYGDFSYYVIRMVQDMIVVRLNELYAENGLVGFIGYARWDGELLNTSAVKHLILA